MCLQGQKSAMLMGKSNISDSHLQCLPSSWSLWPGRQRHWIRPAVCWTQRCSQPPFLTLQEWTAENTHTHTGGDALRRVDIVQHEDQTSHNKGDCSVSVSCPVSMTLSVPDSTLNSNHINDWTDWNMNEVKNHFKLQVEIRVTLYKHTYSRQMCARKTISYIIIFTASFLCPLIICLSLSLSLFCVFRGLHCKIHYVSVR